MKWISREELAALSQALRGEAADLESPAFLRKWARKLLALAAKIEIERRMRLKDTVPMAPQILIDPDRTVEVVAIAHRITVPRLLSKSRRKAVAEARFVAMYLLYRSGLSFTDAGERLRRDHSSVIHGYQQTVARIARDKEFAGFIGRLEEQIGVGGHREEAA